MLTILKRSKFNNVCIGFLNKNLPRITKSKFGFTSLTLANVNKYSMIQCDKSDDIDEELKNVKGNIELARKEQKIKDDKLDDSFVLILGIVTIILFIF